MLRSNLCDFSDAYVVVKGKILCSNTASQITPFSSECFLRHYGGQLKTAVEQKAGEKIDWKR